MHVDRLVLGCGIVCLGTWTSLAADVDLATRAHRILMTRCSGCHGDDKPRVAGRNVLDRETLLSSRGDEDAWLVPGDPAASNLYVVVSEGYMPYDESFSSTRLPEEEVATIRDWILDGAPFPGNTPRPPLSEADVLRAIGLDLLEKSADDLKSTRHFSIHHLHNNWERVSEKSLRLYRAALAKAVHSLTDRSTRSALRVLPNTHDSVFAVDIGALGWDEHLVDARGVEGPTKWGRIVSAYPYGYEPDSAANVEAFDAYQKIKRLLRGHFDNNIAYVRGDWFVATATRPPLYHDLLDVPPHVATLEKRLGVRRRDDFLEDHLLRAGIQESGVSAQNRLVDWHRMGSRKGSYWISYDFRMNSGRSNLARFPLGPKYENHPFPAFAFEHDGGEIIWRLNNGMQGYMLVDRDGNRIPAGPVSIVWDTRQVSGTPEIVNGLSCIGCHQHGPRRLVDVVGRNNSLFNVPGNRKVRTLFDGGRFQAVLVRDRDDFLAALDEITGEYLKVGADAGKSIEEFPEPVAFVATQYHRDMRLQDVAAELGVEPSFLQANRNRGLVELGLRPLFDGEAIKRSMWAATDDQFSPFHIAVRELVIGVPIGVENVEQEFDRTGLPKDGSPNDERANQ